VDYSLDALERRMVVDPCEQYQRRLDVPHKRSKVSYLPAAFTTTRVSLRKLPASVQVGCMLVVYVLRLPFAVKRPDSVVSLLNFLFYVPVVAAV
jgi:hypothetical protein